MKYADVEKRHLKAGHHKLTGRGMDHKYITVHNTGNPSSTADSERRYLDNPNNTNTTAYHIVVDDKQAIEAIPLLQMAYHAGDGRNGQGNTQSIGIEICESGNYAKAEQNAVELIADLLKLKGLEIESVVPHRHWNGKQCPRLILPYWDDFIARVEKELKGGNKVTKVPDWQVVAIKQVCERFGLDVDQWLAKAGEPITVGEFFGVLNKVCK